MRLVSLCPSITEALFELGVGSAVVGATKFCVSPAAGLKRVERVGGTKDPDVERIDALRPSLVFMNEEENRREDHDALVARGIQVHASFPRGPADVPGMLRSFGEAVGRGPRSEELSARVEQAIEEVGNGRSGSGPGPAFLVLVWRKPWIAAGPDTFLSRLLEAAGGRNVLPSLGPRYRTLLDAELSALSVNRVLLPSEPFPFRIRHVDELRTHIRIEPSGFILCDGRALTWHGPRTADALRSAARWFAAADSSIDHSH